MKHILNLSSKKEPEVVIVEKIILKKRSFFMETLRVILAVVIVSGTIWGVSFAGSLIPPSGTPSKTMYTLDDIYTLVTTGTTTPSTNFTTPGSATSTFHTLTDIVNAYHVPSTTSNPNSIGPFVSDGQPDNGYLDQNTGLIWENTDAGQYLCWDGNQGCGPIQAVEYCQYLDADGVTVDGTPQNIWRLPTIKEWESVLDYSNDAYNTYGVATALPNTPNAYYWSSTEYAPSNFYAWVVGTVGGSLDVYNENGYALARCVR